MLSGKIKYHSVLSDYFKSQILFFDGDLQKKPNIRKCMEQPWQQTKAELWDEVTETLCNLDFIQAKAVAKMTYELVLDFNDVLGIIPDNAENIRVEKERQERMEKYTQDLIACAKGEIAINELEIPESITPWTQEKLDAEILRMKTNPTRVDKLKEFLNFLGQEASNLQEYSSEFSHFATQQAWNHSDGGPVGSSAEKAPADNFKSLLVHSKSTRRQWNTLPQAIITLKGHIKPVNAISITPDGKKVISASSDNSIILWDMVTGQPMRKLENRQIYLNLSVAISADGKVALSSSGNDCLLWDLSSGSIINVLKGHTRTVNAVAITPDGKKAISGSEDNTCIFWDLNSGSIINTLKGHVYGVKAVAITPDGKTAITGSQDHTCISWNLDSGQKIKTMCGHSSWINSVDITPDGKKAISGSFDHTCIFWDLLSGTAVFNLKEHSNSVNSVAITPDAKLAISGSWDNNCLIWDLVTGKSINKLMGHSSYINSAAITPDGKKGVSCSVDTNCIVWDLNRRPINYIKKGHTGYIHKIAVTPDGKKAVSGASDDIRITWDLNSMQIINTLRTSSVQAITAHPDGKSTISGSRGSYSNSWDNSCVVCDINTGKILLTFKGKTYAVNSLAISYDGSKAFSGGDNTCTLWDLKSGDAIHIMEGHSSDVISVAISPDDRRAVSGSWDNTCIIWDIPTGKIVHILPGQNSPCNSVAITPDGKKVITSYTDKCIIWNINTGKAIHTLHGHSDRIMAIIVTPDGKKAITCSWDGTSIIWDLESQKKKGVFIGSSPINTISGIAGGVIFGERSGKISILELNKELLSPDGYVVTIRRIWDLESRQYQSPSGDCPLCGCRYQPPASVIAAIEKIAGKAGLKAEQSPCLMLPDETWDDPELLSNCPGCGEKLKFNPFIAGGEDQASKWKFWKR